LLIYLPIVDLPLNIFVLLATGLTVGFVSGMFGVGGGFLMTPLLIFLGIGPGVAVASVTSHITASSFSGALGDPNSDVSKLVRERGGYDLMPEMEYKPTNKYLPARPKRTEAPLIGAAPQLNPLAPQTGGGLLGWVDRLLSS
jgi:Sulfite exporter TauE/SafE